MNDDQTNVVVDVKAERRRKQSEAAKRRWADPDQRTRQSEAATRRWSDPEQRERQSDAQVLVSEQKSQSLKKKWQDPEFRAKQDAANAQRAETMSETVKELWKDPEFRERQQELKSDPERKERNGKAVAEANTRRSLDPIEREKLAEGMRKKWRNPEYRVQATARAAAQVGEKNPAFKHGEAGETNRTVEFTAYNAAKGRCTNKNNKKWKDYGGRGIQFRFGSFVEFLAEVGRRPSPQHSLDRFPNNNGHYEKGNVRWATQKEQVANRRPTEEWQSNCHACGQPLVCEHCRSRQEFAAEEAVESLQVA